MKLFSQIVESDSVDKNYKIVADIEIDIKAKNQGEASYLADSILSSVKNQSEYVIKSVNVVSDMALESFIDVDFNNIPGDLAPEDKIETAWKNAFGDRVPTGTEKMEFYHQLRELGFDGIVIFNSLKGKI